MNWIPAISTSTLLIGVLWLCRNLIITRLKNSVSHEYNSKLATLKSELSNEQESFKSDLRAKELQLESLKNAALGGIAQRQSALFDKQVQAIEILWGQVIDLYPIKCAANTLGAINYDAAIDSTVSDPRAREMFESIGSNVDIKSINTIEADKVRPFISSIAWAYFSAYRAILCHAALKMHTLKKGLKIPNFVDNKYMNTVVSTALPHKKDYIEQVGPDGFHHLINELETFMLSAFESTLLGKEENEKAMKQAAEILEASEKLSNSAIKT
jgi:hypothetical protein